MAVEAELKATGAHPPDSWTPISADRSRALAWRGDSITESWWSPQTHTAARWNFPHAKYELAFLLIPWCISLPAQELTPTDQEWCVGTATGRTSSDAKQKSQKFGGGPYLWGSWRSAPYLHKRKWREKSPPDRKDKIERMRHKSFLVYLLALYVIGWK